MRTKIALAAEEVELMNEQIDRLILVLTQMGGGEAVETAKAEARSILSRLAQAAEEMADGRV